MLEIGTSLLHSRAWPIRRKLPMNATTTTYEQHQLLCSLAHTWWKDIMAVRNVVLLSATFLAFPTRVAEAPIGSKPGGESHCMRCPQREHRQLNCVRQRCWRHLLHRSPADTPITCCRLGTPSPKGRSPPTIDAMLRYPSRYLRTGLAMPGPLRPMQTLPYE